MTGHPELKDMYLKIADYLNTGIRNITARYEQITYTADELPDDMPESIKSFLMLIFTLWQRSEMSENQKI